MSRLPPIEIILHVSDTLALGQILKLRCVCKRWDREAGALLSRFKGIELSYIYDFDMAKRLLAKFCNLECLRLYKCDEASTLILQDVETFAFHTSLTALCCDSAEATSFKHVMETCKQLKALGLRCHEADADLLRHAAAQRRSLTSLDLRGTRIRDVGRLVEAISSDPQQLGLRACEVKADDLTRHLCRFTSLQVLDVGKSSGQLSDESIDVITAACSQLQSLTISHNPCLTQKSIKHASRLPFLSRLAAAGLTFHPLCKLEVLLSQFNDSKLKFLDVSIPRVRDLNQQVVNGTGRGNFQLEEIRAMGWSLLGSTARTIAEDVRKLTSLDASASDSDDSAVQLLSQACSSLRVLRLNGCNKVSDASCESLAQMEELTELDIKMSQVSNEGLKLLMERKLGRPFSVFSLAFCRNVSVTGLRALMQEQSASFDHLRVLNLAGLTLDVDILKLVSSLPLLSWLNVTDTKILIPTTSSSSSISPPASVSSSSSSARQTVIEYAAHIEELPALVMKQEQQSGMATQGFPSWGWQGQANNPSTRGAGAGVSESPPSFPMLQTLHADRCSGIEALFRLLIKTTPPHLRFLTLSGSMSGTDVLVLAQACSSLRELSLRYCSNVQQGDIDMLVGRGIYVNSITRTFFGGTN